VVAEACVERATMLSRTSRCGVCWGRLGVRGEKGVTAVMARTQGLRDATAGFVPVGTTQSQDAGHPTGRMPSGSIGMGPAQVFNTHHVGGLQEAAGSRDKAYHWW